MLVRVRRQTGHFQYVGAAATPGGAQYTCRSGMNTSKSERLARWLPLERLKLVRQNLSRNPEPALRRRCFRAPQCASNARPGVAAGIARPTSHTATPAANDETRDVRARQYTTSAFVAGNDAPRLGERAATRGRSRTEAAMGARGRGERYPFGSQLYGSRPSRAADGAGSAFRVRTHPPPSPPTRRSSPNAQPRAGAAKRNAMICSEDPPPASVPHRNARGERRDQGRARSSPTATCRSAAALPEWTG
jgi:hypothetical protein